MNILSDEYVAEDDWASAHNVNRRTVKRYRDEPDGLPYVRFGGRIFIHNPSAREWLLRRTKRPNPRRS